MASVKFEKGSEEILMLNEYFQFVKLRSGYLKKYKNIPLAKKLLEAFENLLEELPEDELSGSIYEKDNIGFKMFQDFLEVIKKYYIPEETDEYWESVIADMDSFAKKYASVPLARKIAMAFLKTMEEELEKGKNEKL